MKARRTLALVLAVLVLCGLVSACGDDSDSSAASDASDGSSSETSGGGDDESEGDGEVAIDRTAILKYGGMQATALDPVNFGHPSGKRTYRLIYDTLISYTQDGTELIPWLAESWEIVAPTEVTLTLREDVVFQDGTPFNAEAVKFNLDRALTDPDSVLVSDLFMLDSVEVVDDHTVTLHLSTPAIEPLLHQLGSFPGMMASPTAVEAAGSSAAFSENPVGAGPYAYAGNFVPNETLSVRAWDGYWNPDGQMLGGVDIIAVPLANLNAQINALRSGAVDFTPLDGYAGIETIEDDPDLRLLIGDGENVRSLFLNESMPPFDDPAVREAIAYAVDRVTLADLQTTGLGEVWYQFAPPDHPLSNDDVPMYAYDVERARQILTDAGHTDPIPFTLAVSSASPDFVNALSIIAAQLNEDGLFDVSVEQLAPSDAFSLLFTGGPNDHGSQQASALNSTLPKAGLDNFFRSYFTEEGQLNIGGGALVPDIEELLAEAAAIDPADSVELYQEIQRRVLEEDRSFLPLYLVPQVSGFASYVGGVSRAYPRDGHPADFPIREMYITEGRVPAPDATP